MAVRAMTLQANAALVRKLSAGQDGAADNPRSLLRALRLGLARAAGGGMGLTLSVIGAKQSVCAQDELISKVRDGWLLLMFVSDQGGSAAFCLDPGCVSAIVQQQTIGVVTSGPSPERTFTNTDAAMAAPLVEDMMTRARQLVETPEDIASLSGFEYAARAEDKSALVLAMTDDVYRVFNLTVELAGGAHQGEICILLPQCPVADEDQNADILGTGLNLKQASGVIRAELNAVLCRVSLSLTTLSSLSVGEVLPLGPAKVDRVELRAIDRTRAALGRLGQSGGMRAVRLNESTATPMLTQAGPQTFLANQSGGVSSEMPDLPPTEPPETGVITEPVSHGLPVRADGLRAPDSDQMVAEISHLAGLTNTDKEG